VDWAGNLRVIGYRDGNGFGGAKAITKQAVRYEVDASAVA